MEEYDPDDEYYYDALDSDLESREIDYPDETEHEDEEDSDSSVSSSSFLGTTSSSMSGWNTTTTTTLGNDAEYDEPPNNFEGYPVTFTMMQCTICCEDGPLLQDKRNDFILSLEVLDRYDTSSFRNSRTGLLQPTVLVCGPCRKSGHLFCVRCLRRMIVEDLKITLQRDNGYFLCPFPYDGGPCTNDIGYRQSFTETGLKHIMNSDEMGKYYQQTARYSNDYSVSTDNYNHYLHIPESCRHPILPFPPLLQHNEIKTKMCLEQLLNILDSEHMSVLCKECLVPMEKSTDCNCLSHCGMETCYVCGFSDTRIPHDHWLSFTNPNGCPRYNWDRYWNKTRHCGFLCHQGDCYTESSRCDIKEHQRGIQNMHNIRKEFHIRALWNSLPDPLKSNIQQNMSSKPKQTLLRLIKKG